MPSSRRRTTPLSAERRTQRARKAGLSRTYPPDHPKVVEADRTLKALRLQEYIKRNLAEAPPLSEEQRAKLAELLRPVRVGGGDHAA